MVAFVIIGDGGEKFVAGDEDFLGAALDGVAHDGALGADILAFDAVGFAGREGFGEGGAADDVGDFIEPGEALLGGERGEGGGAAGAAAEEGGDGRTEVIGDFGFGVGEDELEEATGLGHEDEFRGGLAGDGGVAGGGNSAVFAEPVIVVHGSCAESYVRLAS